MLSGICFKTEFRQSLLPEADFALFYDTSNSAHYCLHYFFFPVTLLPNAGHGLLHIEVSRSHTTTRHSRLDFSGRVIRPSQRPLPDDTQYSTQTDVHAPRGIRTHNPSNRAAVDPRLRPRGHCDRLLSIVQIDNSCFMRQNAESIAQNFFACRNQDVRNIYTVLLKFWDMDFVFAF